MSLQIHFFATKADLLPVLESIEKAREIKYVQCGGASGPTAAEFFCSNSLPNLGFASSESSISSETFLICARSEEVRPRKVAGRYLFDQLYNPNTVTFTPGGLWGKNVLLCGRFATTTTEGVARDLMKLMRSAVRTHFKKVKAYYLGKEAEQMLDGGKRLASAAQSPRTHDLSRT